jgi:hypothetical protein
VKDRFPLAKHLELKENTMDGLTGTDITVREAAFAGIAVIAAFLLVSSIGKLLCDSIIGG